MVKNKLSSAYLRRSVELTYAVVALFALTQGPVYRLWSESGQYQKFIALPTIGQAHFSTFVAIQLPGCFLWFRGLTDDMWRLRHFRLLVGLLSWLALSVLWSAFARQSLSEFIALVLTTGFGLYLASRFTAVEFWSIICSAMTIGLLWSVYAILMEWKGAIGADRNYWIGIYYNRNSLAPVAGIAVLGAIGLISANKTRQFSKKLFIALISTAIAVSAVIVLWQAESRTSPLALVVSVVTVSLWLTLRWLFRKFSKENLVRSLAAATALCIVGITLFMLLAGLDRFSLPGELSTFNSRRGLWSQNWSGFLEKPWLGWGWMAARHTLSFYFLGAWWAAIDSKWSHNGYHDLLLGGGVPAGLLFVAVVIVAIRSYDEVEKWKDSIPRFLMVCFVLAAATQESFFIGSHFLWALLIASLFAEELRSAASIDQQYTSHRTT